MENELDARQRETLLRAETSAEGYDRLYAEEAKTGYSAYDRPYWDSHYYPLYKKAYEEVRRLGGAQVLEVGCGNGSFAHLLFDQSTIDYHGFDFNAAAIRKAATMTNRPERFSVARAGEDALQGRSYDTIVCLEVLEHIEQDREVVKSWKPGCRCVCSVPNFDDPDHVRLFMDETEVQERYGDLIDIDSIQRVPRALVLGRGWTEYFRALRWNRNNPKRFLGLLGYKTFENVSGWLVFSGRRR